MNKKIATFLLITAFLLSTGAGTAKAFKTQEFLFEQGGDPGSKVVDSQLKVFAQPGYSKVTYQAQLPTDYFDRNNKSNINFQISPTDSDSEKNYQITYHPSQNDWNWRYMAPSLSQTEKKKGKSSVESLDKIDSVNFIDNEEKPDVVEVTVSMPDSRQSFGVQATDGGEGYDAFHTVNWEDKDGEGDLYQYGGFSDKGTASHQVVETNVQGLTNVEADVGKEFNSIQVTGSVDYGKVYPGYRSPTKDLSIVNIGSQDVEVTPKLGDNAPTTFQGENFGITIENGGEKSRIGDFSAKIESQAYCDNADDKLLEDEKISEGDSCNKEYEFRNELNLETYLNLEKYEGDASGTQKGKIFYIAMPAE